MTESLGHHPPILYLPCFDYQVHRQRPQQLLFELSRLGFQVVYCNVTQDKTKPFVALSDTFIVCQDIDAVNRKAEVIMWLTHGPYADLLPEFNCKLVVGDVADVCAEEFASYAAWQDRKLQASDIVLCASDIIYEQTRPKHPRALLIRNAADYGHFAQAARDGGSLPFETEAMRLARNTSPVIGFWGAVASWLDYELIGYLGKERPNYSFVFVGEISSTGPDKLGPLPNVRWLGNRDYESLPAFARQFDAAIIPFQLRQVTEAANPVKLYEYMAAGLPVVSSDLPEVRRYAGVRIGRSPQDWLRQLDEALVADRSPDSVKLRRMQAQAESWSARARTVAEAMLDVLGSSPVRNGPAVSGPHDSRPLAGKIAEPPPAGRNAGSASGSQ